jgi:P pilus assembly chaperone PapD
MGVMAWVAGAGVAQATLVLEGTRIVYPEKAKDVSIRVRNPGSYPILAQSWLDDGRPNLSPEVMVVPFIVSPALTRVEPDGSALLRVFHAKRPLPTDRESLFYLNVMETPPRGSEENALTLQFRTRVKLFFRPTGLSGDAGDAPDSLTWTLVPGAGAVEVHNPTPYHVSFLSVELETAGRREILDRAGQDAMVAPFSKLRFPVSAGRNPVPGQSQIHYWAINDFGGRHSYQRPLSSP